MVAAARTWTEALCGGSTRASAIAVLCSSEVPLTAYAVAHIGALSIPKTYAELRRLSEAGVVTVSTGPGGRRVYEVTDPDLKRLFARRNTILSWDEWVRQDSRRRTSGSRSMSASRRIDLARFPASPGSLPNRAEFERPAAKDEDLRRAGVRRSRISRRLE